jgi:metal-responsive CopG/Arc/MetJ family transcriptional regulator
MASGIPRRARGLLPRKDVRLHVAVDAVLYEQICDTIERTGTSMSEVVRAALRSYCAAEGQVSP